ncbi:hypothetical protein JVT61DRAFT_15447 [Boletus reticuloceps]|uniref:SPX domain-containing protein n=1 Tax=Boletus reticuloceps TaxID=495285 RepID=A0A8I2YRB6_9AGAM|nr:hypothetical protein JVT61DRAFT_15447 [Boletus reticuloceps]
MKDEYLTRRNSTLARIAGLSAPGAGASMSDTTNSKPSWNVTLVTLPPCVTGTASTPPSQQTPLPPRTPRSPPVSPFFRDPAGSPTPPPLRTILANLPATHTRFFNMLDAELEKVESFYAEREKDINERAKQIREQVNELGIHRELFHQSSDSKTQGWTKSARFAVPSAFSSLMQWFDQHAIPKDSDQAGGGGILASESGRNGHRGIVDTCNLRTHATEHPRQSGDNSVPSGKEVMTKSDDENDPDSSSKSNAAPSPNALDDSGSPSKRSNSLMRLTFGGPRHPVNHNGYRYTKRRLRKAVVEHYQYGRIFVRKLAIAATVLTRMREFDGLLDR